MGIGKASLYGFGGFMLLGVVAMPFVPEMSPEQDLASGQRYFDSQCETVTQNQKINGRFGRGPAYCNCIKTSMASYFETGDEYRYAAGIQSAAGTERWFLREARMQAGMRSVIKEFDSRLGEDRINDLTSVFFEQAKICARSM